MVKKTSGRPREFDVDVALDAAVEVFWRHGYEGASLTALTEAMQISRPSLYAAYGDKRRLFHLVLRRYASGVGDEPLQALEREPMPEDGVRQFIVTSIRNNTRPDRARGCLLACSAVVTAQLDDTANDLVRGAFESTEQRVRDYFAAAVSAGELPPAPGPAARARLLVDIMNGTAVRARTGETRASLLSRVEEHVAAVVGDG